MVIEKHKRVIELDVHTRDSQLSIEMKLCIYENQNINEWQTVINTADP